jgi:hypothetical protein
MAPPIELQVLKNMKTIYCAYKTGFKDSVNYEECEPLSEPPSGAKPYYKSCEEIKPLAS